MGKLWSMAQSHNVQHFSSVRGTDSRTRILHYCDWKTCIFLVFLPVFYFFNSITLTSYTFCGFSFFFFFHSLLPILVIRLHQPDGECFPVLHQPSCLLQVLSFFLISFHLCSSQSVLGHSLPLALSSPFSHTCLGFLL